MCVHVGEQIPPECLDLLLASDSAFHSLRRHKFNRVATALLALYDVLLRLHSFALLGAVHRSLQADLQAADAHISPSDGSRLSSEVLITPDMAVNAIVFDCAILSRLARISEVSHPAKLLQPSIIEVVNRHSVNDSYHHRYCAAPPSA